MTRREALQTETMLTNLRHVLLCNSDPDKVPFGQTRSDAESLRRISMTLRRWHELECGIDGGCIERGRKAIPTFDAAGYRTDPNCAFESDENGAPYWAYHGASGAPRYRKIPDREAGALKRLAAIMARYPSLSSYVQGDPRGCALYILKPGDVPAGESPDAYYSRGLAVQR